MKTYQEVQEILNYLSPIPVNLPKIYFLGDTGAGKTTIIRKILGTEKFNFPTTRQTRTTVAITEYVISSSLPFMGSFIIKPEDEIRALISEILQDALTKIYKEEISKKPISKNKRLQYIKQTSDQRFRLYYLITEEKQESVISQLVELIPILEKSIENLKKEFPDEPNPQEIFIEWSIGDLSKSKLFDIEDYIYKIIKEKVKTVCNGYDLASGSGSYQVKASDLEKLIEYCKPILSSEIGSISPVIEYARLQGNIISSWLNDKEIVIIDGEGIGHSTKESGQIDSRHYDYFYNSHSIILVEESKKPFVAGGKGALKSIYERGYRDKLLLVFSKLDEVMPFDIDNISRDDQINEVNFSLNNVFSSLEKDDIKINLTEDSIFYLSSLNEEETNEITKEEIINAIGKSIELMSSICDFSKPIYDFEMLSAFLLEAAKEFSTEYATLLRQQHWQTIKAFNRRMAFGNNGFRMFTPVSDIEDKLTARLQVFLGNPQQWTDNVTDKIKNDSINKIKRELNQSLLRYAYKSIVRSKQTDWNTALLYSGAGSTETRKHKISIILNSSIPESIEANIASSFKDDIKEIILDAINTSEEIA